MISSVLSFVIHIYFTPLLRYCDISLVVLRHTSLSGYVINHVYLPILFSSPWFVTFPYYCGFYTENASHYSPQHSPLCYPSTMSYVSFSSLISHAWSFILLCIASLHHALQPFSVLSILRHTSNHPQTFLARKSPVHANLGHGTIKRGGGCRMHLFGPRLLI